MKIIEENLLEEDLDDPLNIYLDPNLTEEEKEIKKIKKLLGNRKAFYQYKKRGSLVRDQDYLSIPKRVKDKIIVESIKEEIQNKNKDKIMADKSPEAKIKKEKEKIKENKKKLEENKPQQSVNLHFASHNIGLFSDFHGNFE